MNSNVQAWIDALRSGEYTQGRGFLTKRYADGTDKDCCLGVACKLFVEQNPKGLDVTTEKSYHDYEIVHYGETTAKLPDEVRDWLGLVDDEGRFLSEDGYSWLTVANDTGRPFEEIADLIESQPEGLFR